MKLKFLTNALYVKDDVQHEIPAGTVVEVTNEDDAQGFVDRGTAVNLDEEREEDMTEEYLALQQAKRVDQASVNSGDAVEPTPVLNPNQSEEDKIRRDLENAGL